MILKRFIICLYIASLISLNTTNIINAEELETRTHSFNISNAFFSGFHIPNYQYFQVENYWNVIKVHLNLFYNTSPLTVDELSSVTLYINEVPFYSFRPIVDHYDQQISVSIPVEHIKAGSNSFSILTETTTNSNQTMSNVCRDETIYENWFKILDSSTISIEYNLTPQTNQISEFYDRFLSVDTVKSNQNGIMLPSNHNESELEAAVYTLAGFVRSNNTSNTIIPLLIDGDPAANKKSSLVYVSHYDNLPKEISDTLEKSIDLEKNALMQLITINKQNMLVITSENEELLIKSGKFISNKELMQQVKKNYKLIDENTDISTAALSVSKFVKLTENGDKMSGVGQRKINYFISQPGNRLITESSKIKLNMSYAKNLDFDNSLVTVYINDKPIGSKKLSEAMANSDTLELTIPKNLNISGNFVVNTVFDLELASIDCTADKYYTPWAYIHNTSQLQLNTVDRFDLLFDNYPTPFLSDGGFNQISVVLPNHVDKSTYKTITNVFNVLGKFLQSNQGDVKFFTENSNNLLLENRQIIAIGSYENNRIIRENNDSLYFKYDNNGKAVLSNEKMSIESEYGKIIGSIQLINSPYSKEFGMLVLTGPSSKYYELASQLLSKEEELWKIYGDAVITDTDGNIYPYRFKIDKEDSNYIYNNILERTDVISFSAALLLVLILTIISMIFVVRKYWSKRGGKK